jgi:glycosyltransferase involved in cell wall biosynthesis
MRVAYWTTASLEPRYEAVSREVVDLQHAFPGSWVIAVNPHLRCRISWRGRYAGFHPGLDPALRPFFRWARTKFDIDHVYGNMTPWVFHKTLQEGPIVHTITQSSTNPVREFLERCDAIVVQSTATRDLVLECGVDPGRVRMLHPGCDLGTFRPGEGSGREPIGRSILFATSPRTAEEMKERGVYLLLDAAVSDPSFKYEFLYRDWRNGYTSLPVTRNAIAERKLGNVQLTSTVQTDMHRVYTQHAFTVVPFTSKAGGKECPNSAVESLACGVPVLVSSACPFSTFVEEQGCGVVFEPTPAGLVNAASEGLARWRELSRRARAAAEEYFDARKTLESYESIYRSALMETPCSV